MATLLALTVLHRLVDTELAERIPGIDLQFGWRQKPRQQRSPARVVWVPGDETGNLGKEQGATKVPITVGTNQTARNLADLDELFHVQLQAHDPSCPDDEEGQYSYTRLLYDAWRAAMHRAVHGTTIVGVMHIDSLRWEINNTTEFRRGATIIVVCRVRCPIPADATGWAYPTEVDVTPATDDLQAPTLEVPIVPTP